MTVTGCPIDRLLAHPDNPRTVRTKSAGFQELVASIAANGVLEPLTVRQYDGGLQVLSGHRRMAAAAAAGLDQVPVRDLGVVDDAVAFDIVAMANLHEDLTPLEEGKRAAKWLDRYDQDARAVAGKLGQTPHWVVQHAQIYRNLVGDWSKAIGSAEGERYGASMQSMLTQWTASHWAVIARLPAAMQIAQLKKFQSGSYCSFDRWSVKELEERIGLEMLDLSKAPFDRATCAQCINRTGAQPTFLWADDEDGATGNKEKCLDRKCWDKKCARAEKAAFKELLAQKEIAEAIPLSLLAAPRDYWDGDKYRKEIRSLKKVHGKRLLTADSVEICKEGEAGAVAAIVVAGKGKGAVKWVRPVEEAKGEEGRSYKEQEKQREKRRLAMVEKTQRLYEAVAAVELDPDTALAVGLLLGFPFGEKSKDLAVLTQAKEMLADIGQLWGQIVADRLKAWLVARSKSKWLSDYDFKRLVPAAKFLGLDVKRIAKGEKKTTKKAARKTTKKKVAPRKPRRKKAATVTTCAQCDGDPATCEIGCTPCQAVGK
jgi:ParB/RepB/Spo0J family partition protein